MEHTHERPKDIPYFVFEATEARDERRQKRLVIALLVAIIFLFASNAMWLYVWINFSNTL